MKPVLWIAVAYVALLLVIAEAAHATTPPIRHAKRGNLQGYVCPMIYHGPTLPATKWNILKGVCV